MPQAHYKLTIETQGDRLLAHATGDRTLDTVTAMTIEIFQAALAARISKVLVDVWELKGRLGLLDSYVVVNAVFGKLRGQGLSQAAIVDEPMPSLREWSLETIARNRGFNIRIFINREDALEWLEMS